jgi:hypothetical protein
MLTFREFLFLKRNYDSPVGDLARAVWDHQHRLSGHGYDEIYNLLSFGQACHDAFAALRRVKKNYAKYCAKRALELTTS